VPAYLPRILPCLLSTVTLLQPAYLPSRLAAFHQAEPALQGKQQLLETLFASSLAAPATLPCLPFEQAQQVGTLAAAACLPAGPAEPACSAAVP
jgi:hypothetical protein